MYKTESILGTVASVYELFVIVAELVIWLFIEFMFQLADVATRGIAELQRVGGYAGISVKMVVFMSLFLAITSVVLGFVGASRLRKSGKNGGILLIMAGVLALAVAVALSVISFFLGGWHCITAAMLLTGGIMAVVKKPRPPKKNSGA